VTSPGTRPLGRRVPTDWRHVERYPLRALTPAERPAAVPMAIGVNWYREFDVPVKGRDGRWRVAADGRLTTVRGGHCVCLLPANGRDLKSWWSYYNQGQEGACCGFGCSRMMSLLNRRRYDARWLYHSGQQVDGLPDTPPEEGTLVRACLDILRTVGHRRIRGLRVWESVLEEGIAANRWATDTDDVLATLGRSSEDEIPWLNSWGRQGYPQIVWVPATVHDRLRREDGEYGVVTDR
jgi:hypothetical protein